MRRLLILVSVVVILAATVACDLGPTPESTAERESMARYRERYKKSGGFDPVARSLGQKMK